MNNSDILTIIILVLTVAIIIIGSLFLLRHLKTKRPAVSTAAKPTLQRIAEALLNSGIACLLLGLLFGIVGSFGPEIFIFIGAGLFVPGFVLAIVGSQLK